MLLDTFSSNYMETQTCQEKVLKENQFYFIFGYLLQVELVIGAG